MLVGIYGCLWLGSNNFAVIRVFSHFMSHIHITDKEPFTALAAVFSLAKDLAGKRILLHIDSVCLGI